MAKKKARRFGWGWVNERGQLVKKCIYTNMGGRLYIVGVTTKAEAKYRAADSDRIVRGVFQEV